MKKTNRISANKIAIINVLAAVICVLIYSPILFLKVGPYITSAFLIKSAVIGCLLVVILATTAFALSGSSTNGTRKFVLFLNGMLILQASYECAKFAYFSIVIWSYYFAPLVIVILALLNIHALRRLMINVCKPV